MQLNGKSSHVRANAGSCAPSPCAMKGGPQSCSLLGATFKSSETDELYRLKLSEGGGDQTKFNYSIK